MAIWRLRVAFWIPKATNTHPQYVTLIAFPHQQRSHENASMLRYTDIAAEAVAYPGIFFRGGSTNSVEDRERGDLGAVAP